MAEGAKFEGYNPIPEIALDDVFIILDKSDTTQSLDGSTVYGTGTQLIDFVNKYANSSVENVYDDIAAMLADQANQGTGNLQRVIDASADPAVTSGQAFYEYLGTTDQDLQDYIKLTEAQSEALGNEFAYKIKRVRSKENEANTVNSNAVNGNVLFVTNGTNITHIVLDRAFTSIMQNVQDLSSGKDFYLNIYNADKETNLRADITSYELVNGGDNLKIGVTGIRDSELAEGETLHFDLPLEKTENTNTERVNTIEIPTGFGNPFGSLIIKRGLNGTQLLSVDKDTYRKKLYTSTDRYVDSINGSDSNDGLTWAKAYKTLQNAYDDTPDRIYLVGGQNYWRLAASFVNDVELISVGGKSTYCYGITGDERTWTDQSGGVWSNVLSASIQGVFDTTSYDVNGFPVAYQEMTNLTDVQNTSGSFWKDTGTNTLYIHTADDLTPSRNSIVAQISEVTISSAVNNFHTDNITFLGGFRYLSGNTSKDSFYRTDFIYSDVNGYFSSMIDKYVYLEQCSAYRNFDDGFDYDGSTNVIEVNCIAFENGYNASTGINNGSTAHSNAKVLRINGIYHSNEGPNVHDVNDAKSLNIDCVAYNSTSSVADNKSAFACGLSTDAAEMWLDGCSTKNDDTFGAEIRSVNATIFIRNTDIKNIEAGTSLTSY